MFFQTNVETLCTYNFRHLECLQLHCFCFLGVPSFASLDLDLDFGDSGFLKQKKGEEKCQQNSQMQHKRLY